MKHLQMLTILCATVICLAAAQQVAAQPLPQDPLPPPWHGQVSQTYQWWLFETDETGQGLPGGLIPDGPGPLDNGPPYVPGYLPGTNAVVYPDPGWYAIDPLHGSERTGIFSLSGTIDVTVTNHEPPNEFKWMWVQITWAQEFAGGTDVPTIYNLDPIAHPDYQVRITDEKDWGDGWITSLFQWRIYPNPTQESFTIGYSDQGILIDELVIDTWCIPEPGTVSLLLIGVVMGLRRRRG